MLGLACPLAALVLLAGAVSAQARAAGTGAPDGAGSGSGASGSSPTGGAAAGGAPGGSTSPTGSTSPGTGTAGAPGPRRRPPGPLRPHPSHRFNAYWAHPTGPVRVRRAPRARARAVAYLHASTEDGLPEAYLILRQDRDPAGHWWLKIRLPRRPNGSTGWVPQWALGPIQVVHKRLVINRTTLRATLYRDGRPIWHSPVGVGKASTPTPHGDFWVREKLVALRGNPIYGPYALGTSAYSRLTDWPGGGVVGIHGTNQPQLIPGRPSHGCIRMPNAAITRLYRLISVGTPITII